MLSYNQWKLLNESLGGPMPLGLKNAPTVGGPVGSHVGSTTSEQLDAEIEELKQLLEAKKKAKKKMLDLGKNGDDEDEVDIDMDDKNGSPDDVDIDADAEDEVDVDMDDDEDENGEIALAKKKSKKKAKKKAKKEHVSIDSLLKNAQQKTASLYEATTKKGKLLEESETSAEETVQAEPKCANIEQQIAELSRLIEAKKAKKKMNGDMGMDMDMDDDEDDEGGCPPSDDKGGDEVDIDMDDDKGGEIALAKKKSKKKAKKKAKKESVDPQEEFLKSVHSMLNAPPEPRYWDGISKQVKEDALVPPSDPNEGLGSQEPGPGEVGYGPDTRIGWGS